VITVLQGAKRKGGEMKKAQEKEKNKENEEKEERSKVYVEMLLRPCDCSRRHR